MNQPAVIDTDFDAQENQAMVLSSEPLASREAEFVQQLFNAQIEGLGCLPAHLGLNEHDFNLFVIFFEDIVASYVPQQMDAQSSEESSIRQELLELRRDEWQSLVDLLLAHTQKDVSTSNWMAQILAAACMGSNHLWRDLGMSSREQLRAFIEHYFPALANKNTQDMRWKKFFYRQLCESGGDYVCRSPSCETCPTYDDCYGEEL